MAADYRRKRLNGASMVACGFPEQHRTKRKNMGQLRKELAMKSHIAVEWDGNQQRVVAKREQIGISWRQMRPFISFVPSGHSILADVLAIPPELFDLDDLCEVLSYEVWNTHLSENERNYLIQFLPNGSKPHRVVQELLSGDKFNFGNPFMKWGSALCSGDLHPDMIVYQEQRLKFDKRAYYSQLHNYHNDIIGSLMKLKKKWECGKTGLERSKNVEKRIPSPLNEFRVFNHDGNVSGTSEFFSLGVEEKAWSDNRHSKMGQNGKHHRRAPDNDFDKCKPRNSIASLDGMLNEDARPKKGENVHELNIHASDGSKHMSCIKISKKQHELVKSMKLSGKSILYRTLNHVLGDINNINVQPYEVFIKEEQKKMHMHWLQLVSKYLPAAYANWTDRQTQILAIRNSLLVEMKDKSKALVEDEDIVNSGVHLMKDQQEDNGTNDQSSMEDDGDSISRSPENESLHNSYHFCNKELNHMNMDSENNCVISRSESSDYTSQSKTENSRNTNNAQDVRAGDGAPFSSDGQVWQSVEMPHSYYNSPASNEYTANGLSLVNARVSEEQQTGQVNLESDLRQVTSKELLHKQSDDVPFSSYQSQNQIDLLQSLFNLEGVNSYHNEQKRVGLDFQASSNVMMGNGSQFSSHFKEPLQTSLTLDQGLRRGGSGEVYMPENMAVNNFSDGGKYFIPRQDPSSAVNVNDWAVNAPHMVSPSQHLLNLNAGDLTGQHWFSADNQARGGWNGGSYGANLPGQSLGTGGNPDQGLYSVLTRSQLRSGPSPYNSDIHTDQFLARRNYGALDAGKPRINAVVPPSSHPLDYFSGREAPNTLVPDDAPWMNLPHQHSASHDQSGKPYLSSWNR